MFRPALSSAPMPGMVLDRRRFRRPARWRLDLADWRTQAVIGLLAIGAVTYNALLAIAGARGAPVNTAIVGASEMLLLGVGALIIVTGGLIRRDAVPLGFFYAFLIIAILLSAINGFLFMNMVRNIAIIAVFAMLGLRTGEVTVRRTFMVAAALTLAVLLLEVVSTSAYVSLFSPASYYEKTRGVTTQDWDTSGLFQNASGFASRFTFGLLNHRSASLFLEQVSLANFAAVGSIALISLWERLSWAERLLLAVTIIMIVLTNSTRTGTAIVLVSVPGFFLYPHLPRWGTALAAPIALAAAVAVVVLHGPSETDDFAGRMTITVEALRHLDLATLLGARLSATEHLLDSGFGYAIASSSLLGLLLIWAFVATIMPQVSKAQKRCAYGLNVYIFANMLIGGNAIYSMKVSAPLWLLVGFMIASPMMAGASRPPRWRIW